MRRSDAFPSRYLSKGDVETPVVAVIAEVTLEHMSGTADEESKPVLSFTDDVKPLICNQTNWGVIEEAYGSETADWQGREIEVYHDPNIQFGNKRVGGLRVRIPGGNRTAAPRGGDVGRHRDATEGDVKRSFMKLAGQMPDAIDAATDEGKEQLRQEWERFLEENKDLAGDWPQLADRVQSFWDEDLPV